MNESVKNIVIDELEALKQRIASNIIANKQNASGKSIASLEVSPESDSVKLLGRFPFGTFETGRKAGKTPKGFTDIILQWIISKGIQAPSIPYVRKPSEKWQPKYTPARRGNLALAGAIAHTIKTQGTKLHFYGGRNDVYSNEIPTTIENIDKKIREYYEVEIVESIKINK